MGLTCRVWKNRSSPTLIAEVAQAHDGSLGTAHAFIDLVADAGFDAIKFQTHFAHAESTLDEPFRVSFSRQDSNRFSYWKRMEFSSQQWRGLRDHARERGLLFLSTPFSLEAFRLLNDLDVPAWKMGSGEFRSWELLNAMLETGKPILLSTGMSSWLEIEEMVHRIQHRGNELVLMQCTSKYPTPLQNVGLNMLSLYKERFDCEVGLSDHSGTPWPALAAMARGVSVVEVHVAMHRRAFGPDVSASLLPDELTLLAQAREAFVAMDDHPVDKDDLALEMGSLREIFSRSVCVLRELPAGTVLTREDLTLKKPGGGISGDQIDCLVGRKLVKPVVPNRLLSWDDLAIDD
jgi:N-acetylneuraminate synthase